LPSPTKPNSQREIGHAGSAFTQPKVSAEGLVSSRTPHFPYVFQQDGNRSGAETNLAARARMGACAWCMNGAYHGQGLGVRQPFAISSPATLPCAIAADADIKHVAHLGQCICLVVQVDLGILHRTSLPKYAVAFSGWPWAIIISFSRISRATSALSRESSIASGVTTLPPPPLSLPCAAALI